MAQPLPQALSLVPSADQVDQAIEAAGLAVDATGSALRGALTSVILELADRCCQQRDNAHALVRSAEAGNPNPFYLQLLEECMRRAENHEREARKRAKRLAALKRSMAARAQHAPA